jgi:hypothetical protein
MTNAIKLVGALVLVGGAARAGLEPLRHVDLSTEARRVASQHSTAAASALARGDYAAALLATEHGLAFDANAPWLHYNRAAALGGLHRVDEAAAEFALAEALFGDRDPWGRSIALYGSANMYSNEGLCDRAIPAFNRYVAFVRDKDPTSAALAIRYAQNCRTPMPPVATTPAPVERHPVRGKEKARCEPVERP